MQSEATTVTEYLKSLPEERRRALMEVREVIRANLPEGYEEVMRWGMITYEVPLSVYPDTYNKKPLAYASLASQKNHMAVYLSGIYSDEGTRARFEKAYRATGKRLDVGRSCVRFRTLDDLPLDVVGDAIASIPPREFIGKYERARAKARSAKGKKRGPGKRP